MLIIYILEAKQLIVFQFFLTNFVLLLPNAYLVDDALY